MFLRAKPATTIKNAKPALALFDFDGTLTSRDTFLDFHRFYWGTFRLFPAFLEALLRCGLSRRFNRDFLKGAFVAHLWTNVPQKEYLAGARSYAEHCVEKLLLPRALDVFLRHVTMGHEVYIVTASMRDWIEPWACKHGVPVVGTEMEFMEGKLTGRFATPNCWGPEKAARVAEIVNLGKYDKIYAYGNSRGDLEMLALADEKVYNWDHIPRFL
jgi:HAD superfamily hydrolase (TIGR01490 family)